MKISGFSLGFALVLFGLAIGSGLNYLDLRQSETWIDGWVSASSPSHFSGVRQSLETKDEFSKKFSPEMSSILLSDFSTIDADDKQNLQEIPHYLSQKKSFALRTFCTFLLLASLFLTTYLVSRKS